MKLAVAGGVAAVLLVATVSWAMFSGDENPQATPSSSPQPKASASATVLPTEVLTFAGVSVNFPKGWKQSQNSTYTDLIDPADGNRWMRVNVTTEKNAKSALESADRNNAMKCDADTYEKIALTEVDLGGTKGSQLEFRCTIKGIAKHGLWRIAVIKNSARHLYLQVPEETFAKDKAVFDAAVASYKVA